MNTKPNVSKLLFHDAQLPETICVWISEKQIHNHQQSTDFSALLLQLLPLFL